MNWTIIKSQKIENLENIENLLKNNGGTCTIVEIASDVLNKSASDVYSLLGSTDGAVFCLSEDDGDNKLVNFALGYCIGKMIPVFLSDNLYKKENFPKAFSQREVCPLDKKSPFISFSDKNDLVKLLNEYLPDFIAREEKIHSMEALFKKGIPFNPDCFAFEISSSNKENCELFVKAGLDVDSRDSAGTPLICSAARNGKSDMVEWLLSKGADIDAVSKDRGYSAVMDAVWKSNTEMVSMLISKGANLNFVSTDGQTALILATGIGNIKICRMLVENGADPLVKDRMGMSSIDYAYLFKKDELAKYYEENIK